MKQARQQQLLASTFKAGLVQARAFRNLTTQMSIWLEPYGLSATAWAATGVLYVDGDAQMGQLSEQLGVSMPMCTKVMNGLVAAGIAERYRSKGDKRGVSVRLTADGRIMAIEVEAAIRERMRRYLDGVSTQDLISYLGVLDFLASKEEVI